MNTNEITVKKINVNLYIQKLQLQAFNLCLSLCQLNIWPYTVGIEVFSAVNDQS